MPVPPTNVRWHWRSKNRSEDFWESGYESWKIEMESLTRMRLKSNFQENGSRHSISRDRDSTLTPISHQSLARHPIAFSQTSRT